MTLPVDADGTMLEVANTDGKIGDAEDDRYGVEMKDMGISVTLATAALIDCRRIVFSFEDREDSCMFRKSMDSCNLTRGDGAKLG